MLGSSHWQAGEYLYLPECKPRNTRTRKAQGFQIFLSYQLSENVVQQGRLIAPTLGGVVKCPTRIPRASQKVQRDRKHNPLRTSYVRTCIEMFQRVPLSVSLTLF